MPNPTALPQPDPSSPPPRRTAGPPVAELLARGEWQKARRRLQAELREHPDDDDRRRQLIQCLAHEHRYDLLATALKQLREPQVSDLQEVSAILLRARAWKQAAKLLQHAQLLAESATTYYLRAQAQAKGVADEHLPAAKRVEIADLLAQAAAFPDCPEPAILWLADLQRREWRATHSADDWRGAVEAQVAVYMDALAQHPAYTEVRTQLAYCLLEELQDWERAWPLLTSLLEQEPHPPQYDWWAFQTMAARNDLAAAQGYLEQVLRQTQGVGRDKIWGDLLLARGQIAEAIACYSRAVAQADPEIRLYGLLGRAAAYLAAADLPAASADAQAAATAWMDSTELMLLEPCLFWPSGQNIIAYPAGGQCVPVVCRALAAEERPEITPELRGRLLCLWGVYLRDTHHNSPDAQRSPSPTSHDLFCRAAALASHPKIDHQLAYSYVQQGQFAAAVPHALASARGNYEQGQEGGCYFAVLYWAGQRAKSLTPTERLVIHQQALAYLRATPEPDVVLAVGWPFYQDFWGPVLQTGNMYQEVLEAIQALRAQLPPTAAAAIVRLLGRDQAWACGGLGQLDAAQQLYQDYLQTGPADPWALRQLALIQAARRRARGTPAGAIPDKAPRPRAGRARGVRQPAVAPPDRASTAAPRSVTVRLLPAAPAAGAVKAVFFSGQEQVVYRLLVPLLPDRLVLPNVALQAILSYDRMQELLPNPQDFEYYLKALVDFVVTSAEGHPILAIELDSAFHDTARQQKRDQRKEHILAVGGLTLLRLRPTGTTNEEDLRQALGAQLQELGVTVAL